jgi:hypothetical protein
MADQETLKMLASPEVIGAAKLVAGSLGALAAAILTACGVLIRKAFQLGRLHEKNESMAERIDDALKKIDAVASKLVGLQTIESAVGFLQNATTKNTSDIRGLVAAMAREEGIQEGVRRAKSNPDFNGSGGTQ